MKIRDCNALISFFEKKEIRALQSRITSMTSIYLLGNNDDTISQQRN